MTKYFWADYLKVYLIAFSWVSVRREWGWKYHRAVKKGLGRRDLLLDIAQKYINEEAPLHSPRYFLKQLMNPLARRKAGLAPPAISTVKFLFT